MANWRVILNHKTQSWLRLLLLTIIAIYFYVFMEWLFFVTKPSFMDVMATGKKVEVLFITALIFTGFCFFCIAILFGFSNFPGLSKLWKRFLEASVFFPAIILSWTSLLMVDNFSYTLFKFGIVRTEGLTRVLYGLMFLFIFGLWYRWILLQLRTQNHFSPQGQFSKAQLIFCSGLLLVSSGLAFTGLETQNYFNRAGAMTMKVPQPHIILFGGDGLNAANMSVYGYERDTTPNLRKLVETSLFAENAFTNSANTSGSIVSILTGKLPTETRVIYPPDILRGSNAFQHLPGILRTAGYFTAEIGTPSYVDAYELNLLEGFDLVNQRSAKQYYSLPLIEQLPFQNVNYFIRSLFERLLDRLLHIFFIQKMHDPYGEITGEVAGLSDQERFDQLIDLLERADQPLFVHIHMLATHGSKFSPRRQVFSIGQAQDQEWMNDFYDDAILDFDAYVGELVDYLSTSSLFENTILIIYTDHNEHYQTDQPIPLIFHFPGNENSGRVRNNVQNLDIAPTILNYLSLPIPKWMEGQSLIAAEPSPIRRIYSTGVVNTIPNPEKGRWEADPQKAKPPFYQFGFLQVIVCQDIYSINLTNYEFRSGIVDGHTRSCEDQEISDLAAIKQEMLDRLKRDGFNVSALEELVTKEENFPVPN